MPKVQLKKGLKLHYQRVGEGRDVVMIHGLTGNLAVWHFRIIPLLGDRFRILTYDLRGHGYSEMPPTGYSPESMADDLLELLDELEFDRPTLVGHSYGADIALYFALLHPDRVRRVVAIEAVLPALMGVRAQAEWPGWSYWSEVLEKAGCPVPPEFRQDTDYLIRQSLLMPKKWGPLNGLPRNPAPFLKLLDTTSLVRDYEDVGALTVERIGEIQADVHLVYVEGSAFLGSHDCLKAELPSATSRLLPRTDWGHFGPLEQPELIAEHLKTILSDDTDEADAGEPNSASSAVTVASAEALR